MKNNNSSNTVTPLLKVSARGDVKAIASAISGTIIRDGVFPEIRAIGHGAIGQAAKSIAIATGTLASRGITLGTSVHFQTIPDENTGTDISAVVFRTLNVVS